MVAAFTPKGEGLLRILLTLTSRFLNSRHSREPLAGIQLRGWILDKIIRE